MNLRTAASRLAFLTTVAALSAGLVGTTAVQARSGPSADRNLRLQGGDAQAADRAGAGVREFRRVDVAALPAPSGQASPYEPGMLRPADFGKAAPDVQGVVSLPVLAASNGDPVITEATSFAGMARTKGPTDGEPPDPFVAVGPEHVVQVVNTAIRVWDRNGNHIQSADLFDFFALGDFYDPGQVAYFDPRAIYDSVHGRWIVIEASFDCFPGGGSTVGTGYIDVAVSDGADPTAGWQILSIPYPDVLPDYPGLGTSTDKVVTSANAFLLQDSADPMGCEPTGFLGTEMDVMAWSQLIATSGDIDVDFMYSPTHFPNTFFSWRPAFQTPATSATIFAIAERTDEEVAYARITGSPIGASFPTITLANLTETGVLAPFDPPPQPEQPGSPSTIADAVDARPTDAVWKDNRLAFVSTYPCDPAGGAVENRDCVRVSEIATGTAAPTLVQDFLVAQNTFDLYMGGVGYALNGDLHVVWTRSSSAAGAYPSAYGAYQAAARPANTISQRALLSAGTGTYPGVRWGDYVGVAQDPQVPNAVWQGNQFSAGINGWGTEITQLQTGGSSYVPITPVRVLDTRPGIGIGLTGTFAANTPRTFDVAGELGIPADAIAVTGNVTIVNQTAAGYLSVTPTPVANPASSTINFPLGDTRANNITIPLSSQGRLSAVYKAPAGRTTNLIVDITGYFLAGEEDATYETITPVRVLDTRPGIGIGLSGAFMPNTPRTLSIAGANGIPADATAITGNLTVVGQTRAGFLSITPDPDPTPDTSTLNFPLGDTRANGVSVPLNGSGDLSIVYKASGGSTHVLLDVTGFYREDPSGLLFYPLTPGRVMDTRSVPLSGLSGPFAANTPRRLDVAGHWGAPAGANAITGNLTVVFQTAAGYVSATLASDSTPDTSVLNFPAGDIRANGVTLPLNGQGREWFVYKAAAGRTTHLILDLSGYFD